MILFCDLDDTLLCTDKSVSEGNRRAIHALLDAGHQFAILSGRSIDGGKMIARPLGLDRQGCYLLSYHGNTILDLHRNELLYKHAMDTDAAIEILTECRKQGIYAQTYTEGYTLVPQYDDTAREIIGVTGEAYQVVEDFETLRGKNLFKVLAIDYHDHERLKAFRRFFLPMEKGRVSCFFSCPEYLEYCDGGHDKGSGLLALAKLLDVPVSETVAVGDEHNDISMIRAAGIGVCMKNGHADAKAAADYITEHDNNHEGVAEVIHRFILEPERFG